MDNNILQKINELLFVLKEEQKIEDILEITEDNNPKVYKYLEGVGNQHIDYVMKYGLNSPPREKGSLYLWHKKLENKWEINLYNINKFLNASWDK